MLLTDRPRDMSLPGLQRLPSHWQNFSAIIECRSSGQPSLLRESESPSHTNISIDQISDRSRRNRARQALNSLGWWCRNKIAERVEAAPAEGIENAKELAKFLAVNDDGGADLVNEAGKGPEMVVTQPEQSIRAPVGNWARRGTRAAAQTRGGRNEANPPRKRGKGSRKGGQGTSTRNVPTAFSNVRFKHGARRPTHSIVATFDAIPQTFRDIQLMAAVEDGQDVQVGISAAYSGARRLPVKHNKVASFAPNEGERCSIEFLTQIPVGNKTYYLLYGGE